VGVGGTAVSVGIGVCVGSGVAVPATPPMLQAIAMNNRTTDTMSKLGFFMQILLF